MSRVASPASDSTGIPLNASSPSLFTSASSEQNMIERFSKIDMVTKRYRLNRKKNKVHNHLTKKKSTYSRQRVAAHLANARNNEGLIDESSSLSKSLVGGSINVRKMRVLSFCLPEHVVQRNDVTYAPKKRPRMIMAEKPTDGTVVMYYGDIDDSDFLAAEDHLPTLPNTHVADLLADEFCTQMAHEGYIKVEDRIILKPNRVNLPMGSQSSGTPNTGVADMQQFGEPTPGQSSNEVAKSVSGGNASLNLPQNLVRNTRMLPPRNPQALQISQQLLSGVSMASRPQQLDSQQAVQQLLQQLQQNQQSLIQQQNPQFQRSSMMFGTNQLSHLNGVGQNSNMPIGNHMLNMASPFQLQMLHQQQQQHQQQQPQMQRKMMMGLGTAMEMSNLRNSIVGLAPMGISMGMGVARGIGGGTGISAPMTSIAGMGNIGQNPMNLSQASNITNSIGQQFRPGTMTSTQVDILSLRMAQNHGNILWSHQSSFAGISGARQMHPSSASLSMLGQSLNRANMSSLQRAAMNPMGPPKLMEGMNLYMNQQQQQHQQSQQQQQLQLQQQQQHIQQQLQQQLQQQRQQETSSQLQSVVSLSPSQAGMNLYMNQQQQQQQQQSQQQHQAKKRRI